MLSNEALAEAALALHLVPDLLDDPAVLYALGMLRWLRYQVGRSPDEDREELAAALLLLLPVYSGSPDAIPDPLRHYLDRHPPGGAFDPDVMAKRAAPFLRSASIREALDSRDDGALSAAIEILRDAVAATPSEDPDRNRLLGPLASVLQAHYEASGDLSELDEAVETGEAAVAAAPVDSAERAGALINLGVALLWSYEHRGDLDDLERAIRTGRQAVAVTRGDSTLQIQARSNLGGALLRRFERRGDPADLDEAIEAHEAAVEASDDHPRRAGFLSNLGVVLRLRYEYRGELDDLNRAVDATEAAVTEAPAGHPDRPGSLMHLGAALWTRYLHLGHVTDLDRAIEAGEAAQAAFPAGVPDGTRSLTNLATLLHTRYMRLGRLEDLNRAIEAGEAALAAVADDVPDRGTVLSNLGGSLSARHDRLGQLADLERAIAVGEAALTVIPADSPSRAGTLTNLGLALHRRFGRLGHHADLDRAIQLSEAAVAATPSQFPDRALYLCNLGADLLTRFQHTGASEDRHRAAAALREAATSRTAPASTRANAGNLWGQAAVAGEDWAEAVEGYSAAIDLLSQVATRDLERPDQEFRLGPLAGLASRAAACCLQAGQVDRAVERLEQGRGVLLGHALDTRTDLSTLEREHPELAAEFIRLRREFDGPAGSPLEFPADGPPVLGFSGADFDLPAAGREIDRRLALAEQFERLTADIRSHAGFERFLLPPPVGELLQAADQGPLVLVNVDEIRSDALLLTTSGVQVVPLPALTPGLVRDQVVALLDALDTAQESAAPSGERDRAEAQLLGILGWLWDTIAGPVLEALDITRAPDERAGEGWPRLWWCPSGLLSLLPLHAAGRHATRFDRSPTTVLDRALSAYTPTVRALMHARRRHAARLTGSPSTDGGQLLVVTMPHTPGERDLPGTVEEAVVLRELFRDRVLLLHGELHPEDAARLEDFVLDPAEVGATYERTAAALPTCRWVHFACHATSDATNPSASRLLLADHRTRPLTVLELTRLRLEDAELAFLSACATARTSLRLADEAIQLAAACQVAGYRRVIATLWPIADRPAVRIAADVYQGLADHGADRAALALHQVVRRRRDLDPTRSSRWAAHVYSGA
ncbi:CHAT domain-containing protein [Geodermatophilus normandii]|uniref:CHAT domain-containing protein n=1 Tax=Geodermatophilus normandii TaxID=1137989 RepID=A0A317QPY5_9ACTN|nr:CHAT domain-containing protein [Geodermatophilus normandii]